MAKEEGRCFAVTEVFTNSYIQRFEECLKKQRKTNHSSESENQTEKQQILGKEWRKKEIY